MTFQLVRTGALANIGHFRCAEGVQFPRGTSVICRTPRGLEFGSILATSPMETGRKISETTGSILRKATPEDHLLWSRLQKEHSKAFEDCQNLLKAHNSQATLMDVELLFDGQTIFFYFLGIVSPELEILTQQLATTYEATIQLKPFADALEQGCGPDCGTEAGSGCSNGGCEGCQLAAACAK